MTEKILLLISAMQDHRTPWYAKALVVLLLAYIISPIDLIPDFIPVIGLLDEVILVPVVFTLIYKLIPDSVKQDRSSQDINESQKRRLMRMGVALVVFVWLSIIVLLSVWLK